MRKKKAEFEDDTDDLFFLRDLTSFGIQMNKNRCNLQKPFNIESGLGNSKSVRFGIDGGSGILGQNNLHNVEAIRKFKNGIPEKYISSKAQDGLYMDLNENTDNINYLNRILMYNNNMNVNSNALNINNSYMNVNFNSLSGLFDERDLVSSGERLTDNDSIRKLEIPNILNSKMSKNIYNGKLINFANCNKFMTQTENSMYTKIKSSFNDVSSLKMNHDNKSNNMNRNNNDLVDADRIEDKCSHVDNDNKSSRGIDLFKNFFDNTKMSDGTMVKNRDILRQNSHKKAIRRSVFRNTKLCPWFPKGKCLRGDECNYAHTNEELRPLPIPKKMCPFLMQLGGCKKQNCSYAHCFSEVDDYKKIYDLGQGNFKIKFFESPSKDLNGDLRVLSNYKRLFPSLQCGQCNKIPDIGKDMGELVNLRNNIFLGYNLKKNDQGTNCIFSNFCDEKMRNKDSYLFGDSEISELYNKRNKNSGNELGRVNTFSEITNSVHDNYKLCRGENNQIKLVGLTSDKIELEDDIRAQSSYKLITDKSVSFEDVRLIWSPHNFEASKKSEFDSIETTEPEVNNISCIDKYDNLMQSERCNIKFLQNKSFSDNNRCQIGGKISEDNKIIGKEIKTDETFLRSAITPLNKISENEYTKCCISDYSGNPKNNKISKVFNYSNHEIDGRYMQRNVVSINQDLSSVDSDNKERVFFKVNESRRYIQDEKRNFKQYGINYSNLAVQRDEKLQDYNTNQRGDGNEEKMGKTNDFRLESQSIDSERKNDGPFKIMAKFVANKSQNVAKYKENFESRDDNFVEVLRKAHIQDSEEKSGFKANNVEESEILDNGDLTSPSGTCDKVRIKHNYHSDSFLSHEYLPSDSNDYDDDSINHSSSHISSFCETAESESKTNIMNVIMNPNINDKSMAIKNNGLLLKDFLKLCYEEKVNMKSS